MASYPTSVKSFTSRSNGQTIDASHVNDLQDEVNAIEAGLLQGTAPLNSSNSTVVTLSAGASTIASLSVSALRFSLTNATIASGESTALSLSTSATVFLVSSTSASTAAISTISGIARGGASLGDVVWLNNVGTPSINLTHTNSSVASTSRLVLPLGVTQVLATFEGAGFVYDGNFWRMFNKT